MPHTQTAIHLKGIAQVLAEQRLQVPVHQRSFEWEEQVRELLEDVEAAFGREHEEYFLGTLVIISGTAAQPPHVLDGQQRLATVTLMLAAMAEEFDAANDGRSATTLRDNYLAKFDIVTKTESPQLRLNEADDPYFRTLLKPGYASPTRSAPASHKRLYDARVNVGSWVQRKLACEPDKPDWLGRMFQFLTESAYAIHLTVPDDSNAFLIFETLNDRGLDLSIADLLKNYLLSRAGTEDLRSVLDLWIKAQASLKAYGGEESFRVFLRHFWISKYETVRERDLYRKMKARITSKVNAVEFAQALADGSSLYAAILSTEHEYWQGAPPESRELLRTIHTLGLEQYRPMLLAAMERFPQEGVRDLLKALVGWNVRLIVVGGLGGGVMESKYAELGQAITNASLKTAAEVRAKGKEFVPNDAAFEAAFTTASVSKVGLARYYLRALERGRQGDAQPELIPNDDSGVITLEHILPEKSEGKWPQFSEEEHDAYWKRIGNMVLLQQRANNKLKSSSFDDKKLRFGESKLRLTQEVAACTAWDQAAIAKRQRELAMLAVKVWPV